METELPVIALKELAGNNAPALSALQQAMVPHLGGFINAWWAVWWITLAAVLRYAWVHGTREDA